MWLDLNKTTGMTQTIVMKFGGASLATPDQFDIIADLILEKRKSYDRVVAVVSAMGQTTNELIALAKQIHPSPPQREYDMLISVGERISMALLAMALSKKNVDAVSYTGSQSGIITTSDHTEAKIVEVRPKRLLQSLENNKIVIVAGFQGVSREGEITTLGRGGSDTSAVAIAVAIGAVKVEFYKDVPGVYSHDPKTTHDAQLFESIPYEIALHLTANGAKILHHRCLLLAEKNSMPLHVLSFKSEYQQFGGTTIGCPNPQISEKCYELATQNAS